MTPIYLLLRKVPGIVWVCVFAAALMGVGGYGVYESGIRAGREHEQTAVLQKKVKHDVTILQWYDTVVKHDTIRLTRTLTHYDTLRETVNIHDTVSVLRFIAQADSTVKVCRETVRDLSLSCAAKDSVIRDLNGLLAIREQRAPSHTLRNLALGVVAGAVLHAALVR